MTMLRARHALATLLRSAWSSGSPDTGVVVTPSCSAVSSAGGGDGATEDHCPDGFARGVPGDLGVVHELTPALEGAAVGPNGDVFVSRPDTATIFRVPLDGSAPEAWTTLAGHEPLGMDCGSDGVLHVAHSGNENASVSRVTAKDDPGTPRPEIPGDGGHGARNGVATVNGVGVFATVRRSPDGATIASMKQPKSLALRGGKRLVTADEGLDAIDLAVCGIAR